MRSKLEIVSLSMQSIKLRTANGKRLRNYQNPIEAMQATDRVGGSEIYLLFYKLTILLKQRPE